MENKIKTKKNLLSQPELLVVGCIVFTAIAVIVVPIIFQ